MDKRKPKQRAKTIQSAVGVEVVANQAKVTAGVISIEQTWSGPLPPPSVFNRYPKEVQLAIVKQATMQMKHRHGLENKVTNSNVKNASRGVWFAGSLTLAMVMGGIFLIAIGCSAEGLASIFLPTGFQAGNFLLQRIRNFNWLKREAEEENQKAVSK